MSLYTGSGTKSSRLTHRLLNDTVWEPHPEKDGFSTCIFAPFALLHFSVQNWSHTTRCLATDAQTVSSLPAIWSHEHGELPNVACFKGKLHPKTLTPPKTPLSQFYRPTFLFADFLFILRPLTVHCESWLYVLWVPRLFKNKKSVKEETESSLSCAEV